MAKGEAISLDSFVRVAIALGFTNHLLTMLPDPAVRPVERVQLAGSERQRASGKRVSQGPWVWGDSQE